MRIQVMKAKLFYQEFSKLNTLIQQGDLLVQKPVSSNERKAAVLFKKRVEIM